MAACHQPMRAAPESGRASTTPVVGAAPHSLLAAGTRADIAMRPPGGRVGRRPAFGRANRFSSLERAGQ